MFRTFRAVVIAGALVGLSVAATACPFCSQPEQTLAEVFVQADAAVLGKYAGGEVPKGDKPGTTQYEVVEIARDPLKTLKKGDLITLPRHRAGKKGDLCLLLGNKAALPGWTPIDVTRDGYDYIVQAPDPMRPTAERLKYFVKFLEHKDPMIAADAYGEFGMASFKDMFAMKDALPRAQVRKWLDSPDTPGPRLGLYGLMLGVCGTEDDAEAMEKRISISTQEYRLGIDGIMAGYLLLRGEKGLAVIEKLKFQDEAVPFSESFNALQAVRFMRSYGEGRIEESRLKKSLHSLLARADLADLVIADLARWKDWSIQEQLMGMYGADKFNVPSIKRAIIRYLLECRRDQPKAPQRPAHALSAEKHLATLREKDPKLVKEVEQFLPSEPKTGAAL